jgi:ribosomal protein S18 acetylase RimI-like enzyme
MTIQIRRAVAADGPALGRMGAALMRQHHQFDPARFMLPDGPEAGYEWWLGKEMKSKTAVVLVAEAAGKVIGYAYGRIEDRDWNDLLDKHGGFHDVWVEAGQRGHGAGRLLINELFKTLTDLGATQVVLKTASKNQAAQRLFSNMGWRSTMVEMTRDI